MERDITGFRQDEHGDWIAELRCGHHRHVRHVPPLAERRWVESEAGRAGRIGSALDCARCDRREPPAGLEAHRRTPTFSEVEMPAGLRSRHTTKAGVWGRLRVLSGRLRLVFEAPLALCEVLEAGQSAWIPPEAEHAVQLLGAASFYVEFYRRADAAR